MTRLKAWLRPKALRRNAPGIALVVASVVVLVLVASLLGGPSQKFEAPSTALPSSSPSSSASSSDEIGLKVPRNPTVVVLGDSWAAGFFAELGQGWVDIVSRRLQWQTRVIDGGPDTGFLTRGSANAGTYLERLAREPRDPEVDLVVVQGGLNDVKVPDFDTVRLNRAVRKVLKRVRASYPNAKILMIGPLNPFTPDPGAVDGVDSRISRSAADAHVPYVSPTDGRWFGDDPVTLDKFVGEDRGAHPNNKGHRRYANRLIDELKRLAAIARDRGQ